MNTVEAPLQFSVDKHWFYAYFAPKFWRRYSINGSNDALNDDIERYYGDSYSDPDGKGSVDDYDWFPYWRWWNSAILVLGYQFRLELSGNSWKS